MPERDDVYEAIDEEREYQKMWDRIAIHKDLPDRDENKPVEAWLVWIRHYLRKAESGAATSLDKTETLHQIRKIAALAVACLEYRGAPRRERSGLNPDFISVDEVDLNIDPAPRPDTKEGEDAYYAGWYRELVDKVAKESTLPGSPPLNECVDEVLTKFRQQRDLINRICGAVGLTGGVTTDEYVETAIEMIKEAQEYRKVEGMVSDFDGLFRAIENDVMHNGNMKDGIKDFAVVVGPGETINLNLETAKQTGQIITAKWLNGVHSNAVWNQSMEAWVHPSPKNGESGFIACDDPIEWHFLPATDVEVGGDGTEGV